MDHSLIHKTAELGFTSHASVGSTTPYTALVSVTESAHWDLSH